MVLGFLLVTRGGSLLKHALGVLLLAWRRMLLVGAAALVGGLLVGEMGAVVASGRIPPPLMSQVVVAIFAVAIAYAASMTVLLEEILHGIIATIRLVEGEVTAGARAAAVIAEREAGDVGTGLMRLFGAKPAPAAVATVATVATVAAGVVGAAVGMRGGAPSETDEAISATEEFVTTAPRPRVDARPVPADQLPRIGWAAETGAGMGAASAPAAAVASIPPLPAARSSVESSPPPPLPAPVPAPDQPLAQPESWSLADAPPGEAAPATRPLPVADEVETETAATTVPPPPPSEAGEPGLGSFGEPGRPTRPLSRPISRPLGAVLGDQGAGAETPMDAGDVASDGQAGEATTGGEDAPAS